MNAQLREGTQSVDVLGLLDVIASFMRDGKAGEGVEVAKQVRKNIEELLAAAKEMMRQDAVRNTTFNANPFMADAADRLSAAIANCERVRYSPQPEKVQ